MEYSSDEFYIPSIGEVTKKYVEGQVQSYKPEYSIIQHLPSHVQGRLMEFFHSLQVINSLNHDVFISEQHKKTPPDPIFIES